VDAEHMTKNRPNCVNVVDRIALAKKFAPEAVTTT
jgi:hypothetical protein